MSPLVVVMAPHALSPAPAAASVELSSSAGVAVPVGETWTLPYASAGIAVGVNPSRSIGLRALVSPTGAPRDLEASGGALAGFVVEGRAVPFPDGPARLFGSLSAGFGALVPRDADAPNRVIGLLHVGAGVELTVGQINGGALVLAPSLGVVPDFVYGGPPLSAAAPTAELRLAWRQAGPVRPPEPPAGP